MPSDFDRQLTHHLFATRVQDADPGARNIAQRARRRIRHRRITTTVVSATALLGSGSFVYQRLNQPHHVVTALADQPGADSPASEPDDPPVLVTGPMPTYMMPTTTLFVGSRVGAFEQDPPMVCKGTNCYPAFGQAAEPPNVPKSKIVWQRVDPTLSVLGWGGSQRQPDGSFLSYSTLPGHQSDLKDGGALYSSTDGVSWKLRFPTTRPALATMAVDSDLMLVSTAEATAPASKNGIGDLIVSRGPNGTGRSSIVPLDLRGMEKAGAAVNVTASSLVKRGSTFVLAVALQPQADFGSLLPPDAQNSGWTVEGDHVNVFGAPTAEQRECQQAFGRLAPDSNSPTVGATATPTTVVPEKCAAIISAAPPVARSVKLADLNLAPALLDVFLHPTRVFTSADGFAFTAVPLEQVPTGPLSQLITDDTGFVATTGGSSTRWGGSSAIWRSSDGTSWRKVGTAGPTIEMGAVAGVATVIASDQQTNKVGVLRVAPDGSGLKVVTADVGSVSSTMFMGDVPAIGPAGMITTYQDASPGGSREATVSVQGFSWTVLDLEFSGHLRVVDDSSGAVIYDGPWMPGEPLDSPLLTFPGSPTEPPAATTPPAGLESNEPSLSLQVRTTAGAIKATVGINVLLQAWTNVRSATVMASGQILDSSDGANWTSTKVSDLVDTSKVQVLRFGGTIVDKDKYIVNLLVAGAVGQSPDTITFVGRRK